MIAFTCPGCGKSYSVKDEFAGKKTKCPQCSTSIRVPAAAVRAVAAAEPTEPTVGSENWRISNIERDLLDDWVAGNMFPVASGATATWRSSGSPPDSIDVDATIKCPACLQSFHVPVTGVQTRIKGDRQKLAQAPCPSCRRCSVLVEGVVRSRESPLAVHLIVSIHSAEARSALVDPTMTLMSIHDGPISTAPSHPQDASAHPNVKFVKTDVVDLMGICTYHIYSAPTKKEALAFLEGQVVTEQNVFIVVKTPEGNCNRKNTGIY